MVRLKAFALAAALAATPALAQQKTPDAATTGPDIVVTGMSLKDAKAALAACIARQCPPDKEIDATLAVVETQFVSGEYADARGTLLKSIGRNKRFASAYPVPVSDLLRANSRVAAHLGESGDYFSGALDVIGALKKGLPDTDSRVLGAQLELGDAYAKTGRLPGAIDLYRRVARRAHDLHLSTVQGYALLRVATVYAAASQVRGDGFYTAAIGAADTLIRDPDPALVPFGKAARFLKLKLGIRHGESGAVDRLLAEYRGNGAGTATPVLLYAPKIELPERDFTAQSSGLTISRTITRIQTENVDRQWVDISFEVQPDGKVAEVEVLRKSDKLSGNWVKPILTALAARRYAPLAPDSPSALRVERYTFTAPWTTATGTRSRVRSPIPRIEQVDLSRDPASPPPKAEAS